MSLLLALNGPVAAVAACLLSGDERTWLRRGPRSEFDPERTFLDLVIWNSSSSHYKVALQTLEESACGECRCERPADRAVGAECAGAGVVCTENLIRVDDVMESPKLAE